ncbi:2-oxoglutarate dehydrogenase, E2 component, dihydrolipoamide succinyltransferase [Glycomyces sp. A-F 0318]|uniref:2-oxoglutarate dehydrogenase, E2 component, dihydrolipoamide succinyltransferase n=1 Tax=Glycomyces amatae TaxID=2881355 RepID=UPI001E4FAB82|nr:2-oxoglutarate dehydrogenase, E2 component, dihydrolipoamide succinyltransferase [Glycomyces amatae]MCD0445233.1 2-oxoglutarate dehydrogenase, E2 component, dihydrolipoamide succinyltransferase [Glycomyces amatae]
MSTSVTMPALGESVTEGTVTQWLKKEGDTVEVDEPLLEVSTDKVDTEVPSPVAGVLLKIVAPEDAEVEIGGELAIIGDPSEAGGGAPEAPSQEPAAAPEPEPEPEPAPAAPAAEQAPAPAAEEAPAASGGAEGSEVLLPELGESVTEGTVTQWLKAVGDDVEVDEPLLEISTDKVDTEIPSPAAGTLLEIRVNEDETAEVGSVLAIIGSGQAAPAAAPQAEPTPEVKSEPEPAPAPARSEGTPTKPAPAEPETAAAPEAAAQDRAASPAAQAPAAAPSASKPSGSYVTPLVRKLASENGVDLDEVSGSGVGGRIRKEDVQAVIDAKKAPEPAAAPAQAAPAKAAPAKVEVSPLRGRTEKMSRLRQSAAKALLSSMQTTAQLTTVREVDVTKVAKLRAAKKDEFLERHGVKLSFLPFFSVAAIEALKQYPVVNASMNMEEKTVTYPETENVGFAVDTPKGLIVPVVKDAGDLNIPGLAKRIAEIAKKAREGGLAPDDLFGATFTITNTGSVGALFDTPIVPLGQSAILGTAAIVKRPRVINDPELGEIIAVRSVMHLTLSYDHRLIDGADAARFLEAVTKRIEEGNFEHQLGL